MQQKSSKKEKALRKQTQTVVVFATQPNTPTFNPADIEKFKKLQAKNIETAQSDIEIFERTLRNHPVLHAAQSGNLINLKEFYKHNPDCINLVESNTRYTPLHAAIKGNQSDVFGWLLSKKPNQMVVELTHSYPFHLAASRPFQQYASKLFSKATPEEQKILITARDADGQTALHCAVLSKMFLNIKEFKQLGADFQTRDANGNTLLHTAAMEDHLQTLKTIFLATQDQKIPIDATNNTGDTALHLAAKEGSADIISALLAENAQMDLADSNGQTAIHHAAVTNCQESLIPFFRENVSITILNKQDNDGFTALTRATAFGNYNSLEILLRAGADYTIPTKEGKTATILVREKLLEANKSRDIYSYYERCLALLNQYEKPLALKTTEEQNKKKKKKKKKNKSEATTVVTQPPTDQSLAKTSRIRKRKEIIKDIMLLISQTKHHEKTTLSTQITTLSFLDALKYYWATEKNEYFDHLTNLISDTKNHDEILQSLISPYLGEPPVISIFRATIETLDPNTALIIIHNISRLLHDHLGKKTYQFILSQKDNRSNFFPHTCIEAAKAQQNLSIVQLVFEDIFPTDSPIIDADILFKLNANHESIFHLASCWKDQECLRYVCLHLEDVLNNPALTAGQKNVMLKKFHQICHQTSLTGISISSEDMDCISKVLEKHLKGKNLDQYIQDLQSATQAGLRQNGFHSLSTGKVSADKTAAPCPSPAITTTKKQ